MTRIYVSVVLDATPIRVWELVEDIESHQDWMNDATDIIITSEQTQGVGTTFTVPTKVGPIRLTDKMTITEWEPGDAMGVNHVGLVTGTGRFTLVSEGHNQTTFSWGEDLTFPWWLGGPIGGLIGAKILRRIWHKNLASLAKIVQQAGS